MQHKLFVIIICLSLFLAEAYYESCQISQMELLGKIFAKCSTYIWKTLHLSCSTGFWIRLCYETFQSIDKTKKKFILIFTKLQNLPSYCRLLFNLPFLTNFYISPRCSLKWGKDFPNASTGITWSTVSGGWPWILLTLLGNRNSTYFFQLEYIFAKPLIFSNCIFPVNYDT